MKIIGEKRNTIELISKTSAKRKINEQDNIAEFYWEQNKVRIMQPAGSLE